MRAVVAFLLGFIVVFCIIFSAYAEPEKIGYTLPKIWKSLSNEQKREILQQLVIIKIKDKENCQWYQVTWKEEWDDGFLRINFYGECLEYKDEASL